MLFRKKKSTNHEGFDNNAENYMYGEPNLEVFNKPSFKILTTEDSLTPEVDKLLNRRPKLEYSFKNNVFPGWHKLNAECSEATEPKFLPPRDVNKLIGCGWWYSDDDYRENTMSIGQLGNRQEPVNKVGLEKTHPGGVWMWDLAKAQKMEEDKICSRIKICELADLHFLLMILMVDFLSCLSCFEIRILALRKWEYIYIYILGMSNDPTPIHPQRSSGCNLHRGLFSWALLLRGGRNNVRRGLQSLGGLALR